MQLDPSVVFNLAQVIERQAEVAAVNAAIVLMPVTALVCLAPK
jgi:hypothetical protein